MSYIERDGILKDLQEELELDSIYYNDDVNKGITEGLKLAIKNIKRFPTSDVVEVRHGYWNTSDTILGRCCVCSVCGSCPAMEYKYCPYCGAKMDGERSENGK